MIRTRGRETVRVTKVKGHAEEIDVHSRFRFGWRISKGMLRLILPADLGRRHQSEVLVDPRRRLLKDS